MLGGMFKVVAITASLCVLCVAGGVGFAAYHGSSVVKLAPQPADATVSEGVKPLFRRSTRSSIAPVQDTAPAPPTKDLLPTGTMSVRSDSVPLSVPLPDDHTASMTYPRPIARDRLPVVPLEASSHASSTPQPQWVVGDAEPKTHATDYLIGVYR